MTVHDEGRDGTIGELLDRLYTQLGLRERTTDLEAIRVRVVDDDPGRART